MTFFTGAAFLIATGFFAGAFATLATGFLVLATGFFALPDVLVALEVGFFAFAVDFFAAEAFPTLNFVSTNFEKTDEENFVLTGDLTIRDITQSIALKGTYGGTMTDPWGNVKAGFELSGKVSRKSYGLLWNAVTEAGGAVVSDDVKIVADVQLVKQA